MASAAEAEAKANMGERRSVHRALVRRRQAAWSVNDFSYQVLQLECNVAHRDYVTACRIYQRTRQQNIYQKATARLMHQQEYMRQWVRDWHTCSALEARRLVLWLLWQPDSVVHPVTLDRHAVLRQLILERTPLLPLHNSWVFLPSRALQRHRKPQSLHFAVLVELLLQRADFDVQRTCEDSPPWWLLMWLRLVYTAQHLPALDVMVGQQLPRWDIHQRLVLREKYMFCPNNHRTIYELVHHTKALPLLLTTSAAHIPFEEGGFDFHFGHGNLLANIIRFRPEVLPQLLQVHAWSCKSVWESNHQQPCAIQRAAKKPEHLALLLHHIVQHHTRVPNSWWIDLLQLNISVTWDIMWVFLKYVRPPMADMRGRSLCQKDQAAIREMLLRFQRLWVVLLCTQRGQCNTRPAATPAQAAAMASGHVVHNIAELARMLYDTMLI